MKKVSHSLRKVSHSYKKGVALVGMRHLKTAFINILYFCSYCFFLTTMSFRFLSCVCFKDNRDNFFSYRNFCFKTIGAIFYVLWKNKLWKNKTST